ncbi:MAG: aminotransferase class IV [Flavobacteriaceae bacterium]|jgi:4-amino-4-deoxychorismate lyase|nr:aminotransferase class IV [Flavobacteriaceae bacterium]
MFRLFETILVKNKSFQNIQYHNQRLNDSRKKWWNISEVYFLEKNIEIPANLEQELYRCRVTYDADIHKVEFIPYKPSVITTLQLVICNDINYEYKFENREIFRKLKKDVDKDDILIIKNGLITDTSIANIVFRKGQSWFTPRVPLLGGTQRQKLLQEKRIQLLDISPENLDYFEAFKLINALRTFDSIEEIECKYISR